MTPGRLVLGWNILSREAIGTEVEVRFTPGRHLVELEHRGWETIAEAGAAKWDNHDTGWEHVLGFYERRLEG